MLDIILQGNSFKSKNVVNLFRRNLADSEIYLLSKGLYSARTSNTIDKSKLKTELEALVRILRLKWHFRNEEKYMSSLEKKLMKIEIPNSKYDDITRK